MRAALYDGDTALELTADLWKKFPIDRNQYTGEAVYYTDDFIGFGNGANGVGGSTSGYSTPYIWYSDTASDDPCQVTSTTGVNGGALRLSNGDSGGQTANYEANVGTSTGPFYIDASSPKLLCFEAKVRFNDVTDSACTAFVGLTTEGVPGGANALTDTTGIPLATKDYIGFFRPEDDGNTLDIIYQAASQTRVDLVADATATVADTWIKLGFVYDATQADTKHITFYIDGVKQSTYVTAANITTATFPEEVNLAPIAAIKTMTGDTALTHLDIDWWAFGQLK